MNNSLTGFRPANTLSIIAVIGLAGMCVCGVLNGILGIAEIVDPTRIIDLGGEFNSPWLIGQGVVALFQVPLYLGAVVMFLIWLFRVYKNLDSLETGYREFTAGWAVGWWFVPFANLVKPFQVMREAWCESDPVIDSEPTFLSSSLHSAPTYMGFWWGLWILSNVLDNITGRVVDLNSLANLSAIGFLFVITSGLSLAAALLCIKLVRDITTRQNERFASLLNMRRFDPPPPPNFGDESV